MPTISSSQSAVIGTDASVPAHTAQEAAAKSSSTSSSVKDLLFPHPLAWVATAVMFLLVAVWLAATDMSVAGGGAAFVQKWPLLAILLLPALLLDRRRRLPLIMTALFFTLFGTAARILNHLGASLGMEFADSLLASMDAFLGLGKEVYVRYVAFVNDTEALRNVLSTAYDLHKLAFIFVIIFLAVSGRIERLREFVLLFALTVLITLVIGAKLPAVGAFEHYGMPCWATDRLHPMAGRYFVPFIVSLHDGSMTTINLRAVPGLVSMPSYHTVMALMVPWALRGTSAFVPALAYCLATIAAAPVFGGHYFVDLIGGVVTFLLSLAMICNIFCCRQQ